MSENCDPKLILTVGEKIQEFPVKGSDPAEMIKQMAALIGNEFPFEFKVEATCEECGYRFGGDFKLESLPEGILAEIEADEDLTLPEVVIMNALDEVLCDDEPDMVVRTTIIMVGGDMDEFDLDDLDELDGLDFLSDLFDD